MQKEFIPLLEETDSECRKYFNNRFCAAYLHGSIALGDAVLYVSDMDYYLVVLNGVEKRDREYIKRLESRLQNKYPFVNGVHINMHSLEELKDDKFSRFILRYNSIVYSGRDVVCELEKSGCERMLPNADTAIGRLSFARQCFSKALNGEQPDNTGDIPNDTFYAARKLARYFVIIEGAYFLMALSRFVSFDKATVLRQLRSEAKDFADVLDITERVLCDPIKTGVGRNEYMTVIRPLVEWMFDVVEKAERE